MNKMDDSISLRQQKNRVQNVLGIKKLDCLEKEIASKKKPDIKRLRYLGLRTPLRTPQSKSGGAVDIF